MADDWEALIKQVKDANDIVDVVGSYVALRPVGSTFKGLCPFHDDHRPSFDVDPRRQRYRCWSCQKYGDVLSFVQEHERLGFRDALELLARRAGIPLKNLPQSPHHGRRAAMVDAVRWAADQYQRCLLEDPLAEPARQYLRERQLSEEVLLRFGVGFAPPDGTWLVQRAEQAHQSLALLERVGLLAPRAAGRGWYDRFRDRVMFPIRDARGQPLGFGGRILPGSPYADQAPKYYNSSDTPLFAKSALLFGLDQALKAAIQVGSLAVVEGYTDVLMAHQHGICNVVATMGTALNVRHVQQLQRWVGRVVLVFDADAGGDTGADRALEVFASQNVELAVATLPPGLDPCDLLVRQGAEAFRRVLAEAVDALEFKLNQVTAADDASSVEGQRRGIDSVLSILARLPETPGQDAAVKRELMMNRIAHRFALQEETVWTRLHQLRQEVRRKEEPRRRSQAGGTAQPRRAARPAPQERQLLEMLLGDPALVPQAAAEIAPEQIVHPGLRKLLAGLYALSAEGKPPTLDELRARMDNPGLLASALHLQDVGRHVTDRALRFRQLLEEYRRRHRLEPVKQELHNQLHAATDHAAAVELLRRLSALSPRLPARDPQARGQACSSPDHRRGEPAEDPDPTKGGY